MDVSYIIIDDELSQFSLFYFSSSRVLVAHKQTSSHYVNTI